MSVSKLVHIYNFVIIYNDIICYNTTTQNMANIIILWVCVCTTKDAYNKRLFLYVINGTTIQILQHNFIVEI